MIQRYIKDIIRRFPSIKMAILLFLDMFLISFSIWFLFLLRFEWSIPAQYFLMIRSIVILASLYCIPIFYFIGLYSFAWSYIGISELISLIKASVIGFIFLTTTIYLSKEFPVFTGYPRSTLVISFCMVIILCGSVRFSKRIYKSLFNKKAGKMRTLIVGAGD